MTSPLLPSSAHQQFLSQLVECAGGVDIPGVIPLPEPALLSDDELSQLAAQAVTIVASLPPISALRLSGTTWQRAVWSALLAIPLGQTSSYAELAATAGRPSAARATANACAANNITILVPCHRIISSSGALGGYRWGVRWKKALLEAEKQLVAR